MTPKLNSYESFKTGSKNRVKMNPVGIRNQHLASSELSSFSSLIQSCQQYLRNDLTLKSKHCITTKPDSHFWQTNLGENLTPKLNNCESFKAGSKNRFKMNCRPRTTPIPANVLR